MYRFFLFFIFTIFLYSCDTINISKTIDGENIFYFKGQTNLYSNDDKKKVIKKFYEFSNHENIARQKVNKKCLEFIKINKLRAVNCKYLGTKFTEKALTSLN